MNLQLGNKEDPEATTEGLELWPPGSGQHMTGYGSHLRSVENGRFFPSLETHGPHEGAWLKTIPGIRV